MTPLALTSRAMDAGGNQARSRKEGVSTQFSVMGPMTMAQVILGLHLKDGDARRGYYRSRLMLLAWVVAG